MTSSLLAKFDIDHSSFNSFSKKQDRTGKTLFQQHFFGEEVGQIECIKNSILIWIKVSLSKIRNIKKIAPRGIKEFIDLVKFYKIIYTRA